MQPKRSLSQIILLFAGVAFGLISILGGIAAFLFGFMRGGEPERYLVSMLVMLCGGILWFLSSVITKLHLRQREYVLILAIILLGLTLGISYTFAFCGGECNCSWYHGYPGYWLRITKCVGNLTSLSVWNVNAWNGAWNIDMPSLMADLVFWVNAGLIGASIWKFGKSKQLL